MTEMAMTFDSEESDIIIALISAVGDGVLTEGVVQHPSEHLRSM